MTLNGWYARPGVNNVTLTLDVTSAVTETSEKDNSAAFAFTPQSPISPLIDPGTGKSTTLPSKLIWPMTGRAFLDWGVSRYADVDPRDKTPWISTAASSRRMVTPGWASASPTTRRWMQACRSWRRLREWSPRWWTASSTVKSCPARVSRTRSWSITATAG